MEPSGSHPQKWKALQPSIKSHKPKITINSDFDNIELNTRCEDTCLDQGVDQMNKSKKDHISAGVMEPSGSHPQKWKALQQSSRRSPKSQTKFRSSFDIAELKKSCEGKGLDLVKEQMNKFKKDHMSAEHHNNPLPSENGGSQEKGFEDGAAPQDNVLQPNPQNMKTLLDDEHKHLFARVEQALQEIRKGIFLKLFEELEKKFQTNCDDSAVKFYKVSHGKCFDADKSLLEKVWSIYERRKRESNDRLTLNETTDYQECQYFIVFCTINSRIESDVKTAMEKIPVVPRRIPVILVIMHHTRHSDFQSPHKIWSDVHPNIELSVDVLFHKTKGGLLDCPKNNQAVAQMQEFLLQTNTETESRYF